MHVSHGQTAKGSFCPGLSAGSYSGICLLHLLWKLPYIEVRGKLGGIACPPELLSLIPAPEGQRLHLFHYTSDKLCCWQPSSRTIQSLACLCTILSNSIPELHDHFGKSEHSYGHWLELPRWSKVSVVCGKCYRSTQQQLTQHCVT